MAGAAASGFAAKTLATLADLLMSNGCAIGDRLRTGDG